MAALVNVSILLNSDLLINVGKAMEVMKTKQSEGFEKSMVELRDMIRSRTPRATSELYHSINYQMREIMMIEPRGFAPWTIGFIGEIRSMYPGAGGATLSFGPWAYVSPVERGSVRHWPPFEPLLRWVREVLSPGEDEVGTTFRVARHISKVGTPSRRMFELGEQEFEDKNILEQNMKQAAEEGMAIISAERPWWAF